MLPAAHLLITSRPHIVDIPQLFQHFSQLEVRASDDDIRTYIEKRIVKHNRLKHVVGNDDALRNAIVQTILSNVNGMLVTLRHLLGASLIVS